MTAHDFEAVMAYIDNELPAEAAEQVRLHLEGCEECRKMAAELRGVSEQLSGWTVEAAPAGLTPKRRWSLRSTSLLAAAAGIILVIAIGTTSFRTVSPAPAPPSNVAAIPPEMRIDTLTSTATVAGNPASPPAPAASPQAPAALAKQERFAMARQEAPALPPTGPVIIRTAGLTMLVRDVDAARATLDRIARDAGGYIGSLVSHRARGGAPALTATLRIPAARLDGTIAALKQLGDVSSETQNSDDVTQQWTDLNARLSNARTAEERLKQVLEQRTGRLSDVLNVEREIARVRGEIEQMEAHRKSLDTQISYATVSVELSAERKAEAGLGGPSVSTRLRNAIVDGWKGAFEAVLNLVLFVLTVGPTLLLWALVILPVALIVRRRWQRGAFRLLH